MIRKAGNSAGDAGSRCGELPVGDAAAIMLLAMFILFVVSVPKFDIPGVIAFGAFPLLMVTATGIPLRPVARRLAVTSPFILFMAAGNLLLDRTAAGTIAGFTVTGGMASAAVIVLKALVTLAALLSFMALMPFHRFGTALRSLGVPEVFVTQLLLVYRYSFLLSEEAAMMQKARDLRAFNGRGKGPLVTAALIGSLLIRTTSRAGRIYMAMNARGFRTALSARPSIRMKPAEIAALAGAAMLFLAIRLTF